MAFLCRIKDLWMRFARRLGAINSAVLLTVLFFSIITPLGLILRLLRKSPFLPAPPSASQWVPLSADDDPRKPF